MSSPAPFSPGEWGGIVAGAISLLALFGGGIKWLIGWRDRQRDNFYQRNLSWEQSLKEREASFENDQRAHFARIEARLERAELQAEAALNGYHLIASALRAKDPGNPALRQAEELLRAAFRLDPICPPEMKGMIDRIHEADGGKPRRNREET